MYICVCIYIYIYICYMNACMLSCFSQVWLCAILWTVARQASLSMWFSRQEYWSGLTCSPPRCMLHVCVCVCVWTSPDGKESACNAGDLGLIPRSGRSPGEGNGNPHAHMYACTCIHTHTLFQILFNFMLLQCMEYSSLCYNSLHLLIPDS